MAEGKDQSVRLFLDGCTFAVGRAYLCVHIHTTHIIHTQKPETTSAVFETYCAIYYVFTEMSLIRFLFMKIVYT